MTAIGAVTVTTDNSSGNTVATLTFSGSQTHLARSSTGITS